jgi:hypothetical protein
MKKLIVLTLVFVLLSVTFIPAVAAGGSNNGKQLYAIAGYITAIGTNNTITVKVLVGNRLGDDYLGKEVVIQTYADPFTINGISYAATRLLISGGTVITFDKFEVGQTVSSNGYLVDIDDDGKLDWNAIRVTRDTTSTSW